MKTAIIDVREMDEFESEHAEGAILVPLSNFPKLAPNILKNLNAEKIILMCRSGNRAKLALGQLSGMVNTANVEVFNGGIEEWVKQGKPTVRLKKSSLPIIETGTVGCRFISINGRDFGVVWSSPFFTFVSFCWSGSNFGRRNRILWNGNFVIKNALE